MKLITKKRSVESITKGLTNTVAALLSHAEDQRSEAQRKTMEAAKLLSEREDHASEAMKAAAAAEKIGALLS